MPFRPFGPDAPLINFMNFYCGSNLKLYVFPDMVAFELLWSDCACRCLRWLQLSGKLVCWWLFRAGCQFSLDRITVTNIAGKMKTLHLLGHGTVLQSRAHSWIHSPECISFWFFEVSPMDIESLAGFWCILGFENDGRKCLCLRFAAVVTSRSGFGC